MQEHLCHRLGGVLKEGGIVGAERGVWGWKHGRLARSRGRSQRLDLGLKVDLFIHTDWRACTAADAITRAHPTWAKAWSGNHRWKHGHSLLLLSLGMKLYLIYINISYPIFFSRILDLDHVKYTIYWYISYIHIRNLILSTWIQKRFIYSDPDMYYLYKA